MAQLGPTQFSHIRTCNGITVHLRINPDVAWMTIERRGCGRELIEIADKDVAGVKAEFDAIGGDPEKFMAFVNTAR